MFEVQEALESQKQEFARKVRVKAVRTYCPVYCVWYSSTRQLMKRERGLLSPTTFTRPVSRSLTFTRPILRSLTRLLQGFQDVCTRCPCPGHSCTFLPGGSVQEA